MQIQHCHNPLFQLFVVDRRSDLAPAFHVPGHEVSGRDVHMAALGRAEHINPAMLQKPSYNADNLDVIGITGHSRAQAADAANHHPDFDPGF